MACLTNGEVEHDAEQFTLVVVRDAALGAAVVVVSLKPRVKARNFGRLRETCRTVLELADLISDVPEVFLFVNQAGAKLDDFFNRAGHAFTEPERAGVVFLGVIHGLQRLWTNALHIPEMKEFMRGHCVDWIKSLTDRVGADVDRARVSVLHAASRRPAREMVEERVSVERAIVHPGDRGDDDLADRRDELAGIVVSGIGVDDDTKVRTRFVEVDFMECADLYRRVDEPVVVLR